MVQVLVAEAPKSVYPLCHILSERFELHLVSSMEDARAISFQQIGIILCEIYFDESRMFDLLHYANWHPVAKDIPFICFNAIDSPISKRLEKSVQTACKALGATEFVNLCEWKSALGTEQAYLKFQALIDRIAEGNLPRPLNNPVRLAD